MSIEPSAVRFSFGTKVPPVKAEPKPFTAPTMPFAERARLDCQAVLASWDRTGSKFAGNKEAIAARRVEWLDLLPAGSFGRNEARAAWDMKDCAADSRIKTLEDAGMLRRLAVRPYQWERVA